MRLIIVSVLDYDVLTWPPMAVKQRALHVLYAKRSANQHLIIGSHEHNGMRSAINWPYLLAMRGH